MGEAIDRMGPALLDGAVGATALLGLTALAMVACGQPARRLLLGRAALLGSLAILPLAAFGPVPRLPIRLPLAALAPPLESGRLTPMASRAGRLRLAGRAASGAAVAGMGAAIAVLALGALGGRRALRRTVEPDGPTETLYQSLPYEGTLRRPSLRVSARVRRPVLVGSLRAVILIPPDLDQPGQEEPLRLALLHELAHAERLDPPFSLAAAAASCLWFYLPPAWWIRHQMRIDQEFLADRRASARFGPPPSYAYSLVGLAESRPGPPGPPRAAGTPSTPASALFQRVLMLVRCPFPVEVRPPRAFRLICVPVLACGTVLASGLTVRDRGRDRPQPTGSTGRDHGVVQIARLTIEARRPGPNGRVAPYTFLRTVPDRFELVAEVWANPADLPVMSIGGRRLGPLVERPGDPPLVEGFHNVRVVRDERGVSAWVDGRPVVDRREDGPPPALVGFQAAPHQPGRIKNFVLAW